MAELKACHSKKIIFLGARENAYRPPHFPETIRFRRNTRAYWRPVVCPPFCGKAV